MKRELFQTRLWFLTLLLGVLAAPTVARAHVGSKDVFERVKAGPYKLFVTVRTPTTIPGVARVEVKSSGAAVDSIRITPVPLTGGAVTHPPTADAMAQSAGDSAVFTGNLWMTAAGSWEVRFDISGAGGEQKAAVPIPTVAPSTMTAQRSLGIILGMLGLLLLVGAAGIFAAALRDARLEPHATAATALRRRAFFAATGGLVVVGLLVWGGAEWWKVAAAASSANAYRPSTVKPVLKGNRLELDVTGYQSENQKGRSPSSEDFLPDHGHLMHLYVIRWPEMDAVFHLHPVLAGKGDFRVALPAMPQGKYRLFGDVVHSNGMPETLVASIEVPAKMIGGALGAEDAEGRPQPLDSGMLGSSYTLPDRYVMVWDRPEKITANTAYAFRFRLLDVDGNPATDMQPYLGMAGHAAFVKTDGTVFAHTHPEGSAAMAAMMLADNSQSKGMSEKMAMNMPMHSAAMSNVVEFPYGFPSAGRYRIFIQMKHGTTVETGTFDAIVE